MSVSPHDRPVHRPRARGTGATHSATNTMPFESATSIVGLARWRRRMAPQSSGGGGAVSSEAVAVSSLHAVRKSAERHASKWMRVAAAAHLGLAASAAAARARAQPPRPPARPARASRHAATPGGHVEGEPRGVKGMVAVASSLPYWQQFDEELNTKAAWAARRELRRHPLVVEKLSLWWECAQRSLQSSGARDRETLGRADYVRLSRLLHKAMLEEWDSDDAASVRRRTGRWIPPARTRSAASASRTASSSCRRLDADDRADKYADFLQRLLDDVAVVRRHRLLLARRGRDGVRRLCRGG